VLLWDAACGAFLGVLQRSGPRPLAQPSQGDMAALAGGEAAALRHKIDGHKVAGSLGCSGVWDEAG
jgi:hypothetical protein